MRECYNKLNDKILSEMVAPEMWHAAERNLWRLDSNCFPPSVLLPEEKFRIGREVLTFGPAHVASVNCI